jgi:hypothetical protein
MNRNLFLALKWSGKFIIVLTSLLFFIGGKVQAQGDYISYDDGMTYILNQEAQSSDSSFTQENPDNVASYIKILDFVDTQYPRYPYPIVFGDGDHDGKIEIYRAIYVSSNNKFMRVYEFDIDLNYTITDIQYYGIPWAIGDIDGNGKSDLVIQSGDPGLGGNGYLRIYESPDAFSYPSVLKSEITLPGRKVEYRAKIVDTDSDGKKEVLLSANSLSFGDLRIYEWETGSLQLKWTAPQITGITLTKAVADFDGDNQIEIGTVELGTASVYVYESTGNDTYVLRQSWPLAYSGDAVDATNPDGGNSEFAVGLNYDIGGGRTQYKWIFYKETNNTFNQWWETSFSSNMWYSNPRHATGDYDKDGFDEVVVDDHPVLKILKYVDGQMQVTWTSTEPDPIYLTSCDMRNDNFMNFAVVNFTPSEDILSFFEEERLANAYLNKSLTTSATAHNNNHVIERGYYGKLHEVFASDGEIYYRRSSNNGTSWELTTRISNANDFNNHPSIIAAGLGAKDFIYLVWQRKLTNYQYEIYTAYSSNSGYNWLQLSNPISVTVSYSQSNDNWGPGTTPVVASYQIGGVQKYLLVYATESGLYYRTALFGNDWSAATVVPGSFGLNSTIWYPSIATYNNLSTQVNLIYDDRYTHVYSHIFNGTSWANPVVADWIGSYNRTSSIAVDYANSTLGVWSGWNGNNFIIRFRQGYSDGTWSRWCKEWSVSGVNSICPAVTYYNKGGDYPYGIDILWCTESPSKEIHQKKYYGLGDNWIPDDPNTQLIAESGLYANVTHERQNTPIPIQIWTDQSDQPYSILYNSDYLPKGDLLVGGEIHRAAEITNGTDNSYLRIELNEPVITLTNGEQVKIPFKEYNYLDTLELTVENVFDYLQTELINIPNNAQSLTFKVEILAYQPDTLSNGTINTNPQTPFRTINFRLLARDSSQILINNIGNRLLNNLNGIHHYTKEVTVNASVLRGRNIRVLPNINLSGTFNQNNLHFTLINVSIEGDGIGKDFPEIDNLTPTEFSLDQNYPNPFNPVTTISYNIVGIQDVKLTVYDILGREIATLVNEQQQPGSYQVRWDASNAASGIYFYQLKTGGFIEIKKMILLK